MNNLADKQEKNRRVAIYIRVSTPEQKIEGYSPDAQRKKLLSYVNDNTALNLETKKEWIFEDTHTGSDLNRPALQELLEGVRKKKFDAVLVWKIDRLSRSLKHLLVIFDQLEANEVSFISVQENIDFRGPIGRLIFQIFGAIAQFERELIKGRTKMGMIASAEMGNFTGTAIPYGYEPVPNDNGKGKKLKIIPSECEWVKKIFEWYIFEEMGYGLIADRLNELKVPRGQHAKFRHADSPWTVTTIKTIIENPIYRGEFVANRTDDANKLLPEDQWTMVPIPPCIEELTFLQAQRIREKRDSSSKGEVYLLSGKMRDMSVEPSKAFTGKPRSDGAFSYVRKPFDKDGVHYQVFEIPAKQIEAYVWDKVTEAIKDPKLFIETYLSEEFQSPDRVRKIEEDLGRLRAELINIAIEMERYEGRWAKGKMSEESLDRRLQELEAKKTDIEAKIQELEGELQIFSSLNMEIGKLQDASEKVKYRLEHLSPRNRRILVDLFIDRVELNRTPKASQGFGRKNRWQVSALVHFRFNPSKLSLPKNEGRTQKALTQAEKEFSDTLKKKNGGRWKS